MEQRAANPFRYGGVARGEHFTDRETELERLLADIRGGQNVVIVSPRRLGKTSLVERAIEKLRGEGVLVAYVDLFRCPTKERLADHLAQAVYDGLVAPVERAVRKAGAFFASLPISPRITLTEEGRPALEFTSFPRPQDADKIIEGLLGMPGSIARDRERPVALVIDEFQEIVAIDSELAALVRSIAQTQDHVSHVFLGSKRRLMSRLFMEQGGHLYRAAKPLALGPIAIDEFAAFIRDRFEAGRTRILGEAVDEILLLTAGRPYETQELCSFAWSRSQAEGDSVSVPLVHRALVDLLAAESARYVSIWEELPPRQRSLLIALAVEPGPIYAEGYRRRHKLGAPGSVQSSIGRLRERELVELEAGHHRVADVFLREWLVRLDTQAGPA